MVCFVINIWVFPQLGTPHENPWPYFQSPSGVDHYQYTRCGTPGSHNVEFSCLRTKSHLCVKGESSFWVRHVATIPAFLIVKCQSETEEVLTIWPEWQWGYVRISRVSKTAPWSGFRDLSLFEAARGCCQGRQTLVEKCLTVWKLVCGIHLCVLCMF